jgi:hypothetical protein
MSSQSGQNTAVAKIPFPRKHRPRTRLLIFPKFQLPVIAINLGVIIVMTSIIWAVMHNALSDLKPAAGLSSMEAEFYTHYLDYQVASFQRALLVSFVAGSAISTFLTLVITHRFSGPLLRLRGHFRAICQGISPIPHLEFRDGDYLSDLPPLVNGAIERIASERNERAEKLEKSRAS